MVLQFGQLSVRILEDPRVQVIGATFAGSIGHIMGLVEYDDAVLEDALVPGQSGHVQDVVVGHEDDICLLLDGEGVEIGAEAMHSPGLLEDFGCDNFLGEVSFHYLSILGLSAVQCADEFFLLLLVLLHTGVI